MPGFADLGYTDNFKAGTASSSFGENYNAIFDLTRKVDSTLGFEYEFDKRWKESIAAAQARLGEDFGYNTRSSNFGDMSINVAHKFVQPVIDPNGERTLSNFFSSSGPIEKEPEILALSDKARIINERIKQLNDPSIKTIDQIIQDVINERGIIREKASETGETSGWLGTLGGLAGGVAGSFSTRDPLNIITLPFGGWGKSVGMRMLTEAGVVGSTEFAAQKLGINPTQRVLGEPETNALEQAVIVGAAGGLLRGGFEGLSAVTKRVLRGREVDEVVNIRAGLDEVTQTPTVRAAASLLDDAEQFHLSNPYSPSGTGARQFTEDLTDIYNLMSGRTDAAVARFLPEKEFTIDILDFDTTVVRDQQPLVFNRVAETQGRLVEIDGQIKKVSDDIDGLQLLVKVDEPTITVYRAGENAEGGWFTTSKKYAEQLSERDGVPIWTGEVPRSNSLFADATDEEIKAGLTYQKDFGPGEVLNVKPVDELMESLKGSLRDELATLRKERRSAAGQYTKARNVLDTEVTRVRNERELNEKVFGEKEPSGAAFDPQRLRPDVLAKFEADVNANAPVLDGALELTVREMETPEGRIDIGGGILLDRDFKMIDPDNPDLEITAAGLAARLKEDDALLAAMKECSI